SRTEVILLTPKAFANSSPGFIPRGPDCVGRQANSERVSEIKSDDPLPGYRVAILDAPHSPDQMLLANSFRVPLIRRMTLFRGRLPWAAIRERLRRSNESGCCD